MSVEYYKKQIIDLRAKLEKEKEAKKKDNEYYARQVANASSPSSKAELEKQKAEAVAAQAELERIKAETAKAQAEATKALAAVEAQKAAAAKTQAEAEQAAAAKASTSGKSSAVKGAQPMTQLSAELRSKFAFIGRRRLIRASGCKQIFLKNSFGYFTVKYVVE